MRYHIWVEYIGQWASLNPAPAGDEPSFWTKKRALARVAKLQKFYNGLARVRGLDLSESQFYVVDRKGNRVS